MCGFRVYPLAATCALLDRVALGRRMDFDTEVMVRLYWAGVAVRFVPTGSSIPPMAAPLPALARQPRHLLDAHPAGVPPAVGSAAAHRYCWPRRLCARAAQLWRERALVAHPGRGSLLGMQIMLTSYRLLGRRGFSLLLYPVIGYFWLTGRAQRQASQAYLTRLESFADASGVTLPLSRDRHFLRFGEAALDKLAGWRGDITEQEVELVGAEHYQAAINSGQGFCCWAPTSAIWAVPRPGQPQAGAAHQCAGVHPPCGPLQRPAQTDQSGFAP